MNTLVVLLAVLTGPNEGGANLGGVVPRADAAQVFAAYFFNDALVDEGLQDQVVEIRGRVDGIKRTTAPVDPKESRIPAPPAPDPALEGKPELADAPVKSAAGYDLWIPVAVRLRDNDTQQFHVRCHFPASAGRKLAGVASPDGQVVIRGRCLGVTTLNLYEVGPTVFTGPVLEFTDCQLIQARLE